MSPRTAILIVLALLCSSNAVSLSRILYTSNFFCLRKYCINPIFPAMRRLGVDFLAQQEDRQWRCSKSLDSSARKFLSFCKEAVHYDFALHTGNSTIIESIHKEEYQAIQAYSLHLSAMGFEFWEHDKVDSNYYDKCIKSIWEMVCWTYFPKCNVLDESKYLRPCKFACSNYGKMCGVECCDESVSCTFSHATRQDGGSLVESRGYVDHNGPSETCTDGGSNAVVTTSRLLLMDDDVLKPNKKSKVHKRIKRRIKKLERRVKRGKYKSFASSPRGYYLFSIMLSMLFVPMRFTLLIFLLLLIINLQGCNSNLDRSMMASSASSNQDYMNEHSLAFWRSQPDYSVDFAYKRGPVFGIDSCSDANMDATSVCSGNGVCREWATHELGGLLDDGEEFTSSRSPMLFCSCDDEFAGPECNIRRLSQRRAFFLSLFFGYLGADRFYMKDPIRGTLKLITLGGFGLWWVYDIVSIGSGPIYAKQYRLEANLNKTVAVILSIIFFVLIGFGYACYSTLKFVVAKRREAMKSMLLRGSREWEKQQAGVREAENARLLRLQKTVSRTSP